MIDSWGPVYRRLSRCGRFMTPAAKVVLLHVLERLGANSYVWPAQATMADEVGISEKPLRAAIAELEGLGFLRKRRYGHGKVNAYDVDIEAVRGWGLNGVISRSTTTVCDASTAASPGQRGFQREPGPSSTATPPAVHRSDLPSEDPKEKIPQEGPPEGEDPAARSPRHTFSRPDPAVDVARKKARFAYDRRVAEMAGRIDPAHPQRAQRLAQERLGPFVFEPEAIEAAS